MQARRASRELAFILFSQLDEKISKYSKGDFENIILKSVRILTGNAQDELKTAVGTLVDLKNRIDDFEAEHEINLNRPLDATNVAVPLPMTSEFAGKIDDMLDVAEKAMTALEIAEFVTLESQSEVKDYTIKIAEMFQQHQKEIDDQIQQYSKGWDISRLVKMDRDILRIAIIEMLYMKEAPIKVVIDEALELAKKYSTDDSSAFINGILAKVVVDNGLK